MFFSVIGLSFNFIGTLLVAFSIKKGEVEAWKDNSKKPEYMTKKGIIKQCSGVELVF